MDTPTPPEPRRRLPRWLKIIGWLAVWLVTLLALGAAIENWLGARAWRDAVAEAAAAGEKVDLAAVIPPPVPDEQNLAAIPLFKPLFDYEQLPPTRENPFGEAKWRDPAAKERLEKLKLPSAKETTHWREGQFADLAVWQRELAPEEEVAPPQSPGAVVFRALARFDPELDALREAVPRPRSRFPVHYEDHVAAVLPHVGVLREFTRILRVRTLAELSLGDAEAAQRDLLLGLRLAEALREEPLLISQLVRMAQVESLMQPLWEGLARRQWNEAQLGAIDAALQRADFLAAFQNAIRGERAIFGGPALDSVKKDPALMLAALVAPGTPTERSRAGRSIFWLIPSGWIDFNKAHLSRAYGQFIKTADPSARRFFPEAAQRAEDEFKREIGAHRRSPRKLLAALAFPAVARTVERFAESQATVDLARVAIALERHRLAHGTWPESLDTLAPAYRATAPHDVMSGEPLRYRRGPGEGFTLYSVGWNGRDDGGIAVWKKDAKPPRRDPREGDWPWPQAAPAKAE